MRWIHCILEALCVGAIAAGGLVLLWSVCCRILQRGGHARLICVLLKATAMGYLLSFAWLLKWQNEKGERALLLAWIEEKAVQGCLLPLFGVWCVGMAACMAVYVLWWRGLKRLLRARLPVPQEVRRALHQLCQTMHIRRDVQIYRCYGVISPCIYGIVRPKLLLPAVPLEKKQLEMILSHELAHYKHGDPFWKPIFALLTCVFWFSPFSWFAAKQMSKWAEADCDEVCCRQYSPRLYFGMIDELLTEKKSVHSQYISQWSGGAEDLYWRIARVVEKIQKK